MTASSTLLLMIFIIVGQSSGANPAQRQLAPTSLTGQAGDTGNQPDTGTKPPKTAADAANQQGQGNTQNPDPAGDYVVCRFSEAELQRIKAPDRAATLTSADDIK